ncbi:rod-binding protein [Phenylobacterium aquaticum]|uniref:rod-binding protein n=1 Tax=Phenylobacterium aquaticum TaxID=1763816 RepID=UPI0026EA0896|nr:rod-binding protein [Phenylobacterium aquaticum]
MASMISPIALNPALLQASGTAPTAGELSKRANITKTAKDFESSFLSVMVGEMFEGVNTTESTFSGGQGEQMFKSFMTDAIAKQVSRTGGIGIAASVQKEMLKLQGLTEETP